MNNLLAYVDGDEAPGGFLFAVLSHDLFQAIVQADDEMKPLIPLLVQFIRWQIPSGCHGSPEIVKKWMENKNEEKMKKIRQMK